MRRISDDREYLRPPEEYPTAASQIAPPPEEYGDGRETAPSAKKKQKYHWLAAAVAAGLLSTVALFSDVEKSILEPFASPTPMAMVAAATPTPGSDRTPSPTLDHTPSPSPVPTAEPTMTAEPTPSPKPTPEPVTTPGARLVFYKTSEVYHLQVMLDAQDKMEAVTVRLIDRGNGETMWEHELSEDEIAFGWYALSNYDLYASEYAWNHMDQVRQGYEPEPVLEVTYTARGDDGTAETVTEQAEAAYELWISARYDLMDPSQDFLSYFMEETTYPDCFVVRIDPSPYGDLTISYGKDVELQPGDVSVTVKVDGQELPADSCYVEKTEIIRGGDKFYSYAFVMPRPDSFPEHGTAQIEITRRLISYSNHTRSDLKTVEY